MKPLSLLCVLVTLALSWGRNDLSLLESCVSFKFYARIVETSLGRSCAYLTLLAVVSAVAFSAYLQLVILPKLHSASDKLPPLTIKNGKVTVEGETQTATLYADPEKILRIDLDLDKEKGKLAPSHFEYTVVIGKFTVALKRITGEIYTFTLPYGFGVTIHKNALHFFLDSWEWLIALFGFLGAFVFFFAVKFVHAFLLTIPGLVFWGILRRDLTYGRLLTLCIYALTPATLCSVLIQCLNAQFVLPPVVMEFQWLIYFLVAVEYLLGGLLAIPGPATMKTHEKVFSERTV